MTSVKTTNSSYLSDFFWLLAAKFPDFSVDYEVKQFSFLLEGWCSWGFVLCINIVPWAINTYTMQFFFLKAGLHMGAEIPATLHLRQKLHAH